MRSVVVTGTSSGIGAATARHLDRVGMHVFAGVRDLADGEHLVAEASPRLQLIELDITDDASVADAVRQVSDALDGGPLWGLVNNAGEAFPGPMETLALEQLQHQLEVNVVGHVRVTQGFLPSVRQARGRIVFVGSIGGRVSLEFAGAYHTSKYAVEGMADAWRQELAPDGIDVLVIEPGPMSTRIWVKALDRVDALLADPTPALDRYRERLTTFRNRIEVGEDQAQSPEAVAHTIEKALTADRPSTRYPVGLPAKLTGVVQPFVPDRIFDRVARLIGG